jgi:hypothetical protein
VIASVELDRALQLFSHPSIRCYEVQLLTASLNGPQNYTWRHITKDRGRRDVGASDKLGSLVSIRRAGISIRNKAALSSHSSYETATFS